MSHTCLKNRVHMKIQYFEKGTFVRAKILQECQELLGVSLNKIANQYFVIWLFGEYLMLGEKFNKIVITLV